MTQKFKLSQAARDACVQSATYTRGGRSGKDRASKINHIAWEHGESVVVHSRSEEDLANLLISWAGIKHTGVSLVEFGGRRGFNIKCAGPDDNT